MKNKAAFRTLTVIFSAALFLLAAFALFFRPVHEKTGANERVVLSFSDGTKEEIPLSRALFRVTGADETAVLLKSGGKIGRVEGKEEFCACAKGLFSGEATLLFSARGEKLCALEQAALSLRFSDTGYYAGGFFAWDGTRVLPTDARNFWEVYLLDGRIPSGLLQTVKAERLVLKRDAKLYASSLVDSKIESVEAEAPYAVESGAIYQQTAGGRKLVAALPFEEELSLKFDFFEEGALSPCKNLKKLRLPSNFQGTIQMLFGNTPYPKDLEYEIL